MGLDQRASKGVNKMKRNKLIKWFRHFNLWLNKKDSFGHKLAIEFQAERNRIKKITHCINCRFYESFKKDLSDGSCRFYPPQLNNDSYIAAFPNVRHDGWCGQFKEK